MSDKDNVIEGPWYSGTGAPVTWVRITITDSEVFIDKRAIEAVEGHSDGKTTVYTVGGKTWTVNTSIDDVLGLLGIERVHEDA